MTYDAQKRLKPWAKSIARGLVVSSQEGPITLACGFGPTGTAHIGTLSEVLRTCHVADAVLAETGVRPRVVLTVDDFDALRKIPDDLVVDEQFLKYLGLPICFVPDPYGEYQSLSERNIASLVDVTHLHGLDYELVRSSQQYLSGSNNKFIGQFVENRSAINDIIKSSIGPVRRMSYDFLMPLSEKTGRVIEHIKVLDVCLTTGRFIYEIPTDVLVQKPGFDYSLTTHEYYHEESVGVPIEASLFDGKTKLQWKADWAMRHVKDQVSFEMHGVDLIDSAVICQKIRSHLSISPAKFYPYGLFTDSNGKKISKSKGNGLSLTDVGPFMSTEVLANYLLQSPVKSKQFDVLATPKAYSASGKRYNFERQQRFLSTFQPISFQHAKTILDEHLSFSLALGVHEYNYFLDIQKKQLSYFFNPTEADVLANIKEQLVRHLPVDSNGLIEPIFRLIAKDLNLAFGSICRLIYLALFNSESGPRLNSISKLYGLEFLLEKITNINTHVPDTKLTDQYLQSWMRSEIMVQKSNLMPMPVKQDLDVVSVCQQYAGFLESQKELIATALNQYECYEVAIDEIDRSIELLMNIDRNIDFFGYVCGGVTSFLPLNQPVYATVCFGVIPSLQAEHVAIRPPEAMHPHYLKLMNVLGLERFPNLSVSLEDRFSFVARRAPVSNAVIFTGSPENGQKVRKHFRKDCLFILNGSGHNPLVIGAEASIDLAIESALRVVLYNQGQDCAGPNALLVHTEIRSKFIEALIERLDDVAKFVGPYSDRLNIVGPNSNHSHAAKIAPIFTRLRNACVYGGEINPVLGMIKPTVFLQPIEHMQIGYEEFFAPVFNVVEYSSLEQLMGYFLNDKYRDNAMYVSIFGESKLADQLIASGLHSKENIILNTDLHIVEKGYLPYGGVGYAASTIYFEGSRVPGATLPQRDYYHYIIKPSLIAHGNLSNDRESQLVTN